jgi:hypothetical protein
MIGNIQQGLKGSGLSTIEQIIIPLGHHGEILKGKRTINEAEHGR